MGNQDKPKPAAASPDGPPEGPPLGPDTRSIPPLEPLPVRGKAAIAGAVGKLERVAPKPNFEKLFPKATAQMMTDDQLNKFRDAKDDFWKNKMPPLEKLKGNLKATVDPRKVKTVLNLRDDSGKITEKLAPNTEVILTTLEYRKAGGVDFVKVKVGDKEGWVALQYLKPDPIESKNAVAAKIDVDEKAAAAAAAAPAAPEKTTEAPPTIDTIALPLKYKTAQPPELPVFQDDKFYRVNDDITDLVEKKRGELKENDIVYLVRAEGDSLTVEKNDGTRVAIHKDYLDHLDNDSNTEAKNKYRIERYGKYDKLPAIDRDHVRKLNGALVLYLPHEDMGVGFDAYTDNHGHIYKVKTGELDKVNEAEKDRYILARFQNAAADYRQIVLWEKDGPKVTQAAQIQSVDATYLAEGKKAYEKASAETSVVLDTGLTYISEETGMEYRLERSVKNGTKVAIIAEVTNRDRYKVATQDGIIGYIPKGSVGKVVAKKSSTPSGTATA